MPKNGQSKKDRGGVPSVPPPTSSSPRTDFANVAEIALRTAPLPLPSELAGYEEILPGAAERIFTMAEKQSNHRRQLEVTALSFEGRNSLLGIIAAWFLGTLGLLIGGICIYTGHDAAGAAIGGISLVSLVGTFIYGTRERRLEREQKNLALQSQRKLHR